MAASDVCQRYNCPNVMGQLHENGLVDVLCHIHAASHLFKICVLESGGRQGDGDKEARCSLVDVSNLLFFAMLSQHPSGISQPELIMLSTGDEAAFVQELSAGVIAFGFF